MFEHSCGVQTYMHASSLISHDLRKAWLAGGKTPPPPLGAAIIAPALLLCKVLLPSLPDSGALAGTQIT